jgi:homocysteine S-methyltransferase
MANLKNITIRTFLGRQGVMILDGGLATTLEAGGADLGGALWSARLLRDDPEKIRAAHLAFLEAGADCITTASYQGSVQGFMSQGLTRQNAADLLVGSVRLALEARDQFWGLQSNREGRVRPLVAASIGPYGAFTADGAEYTGDYGMSTEKLVGFHRERWELLAGAGANLLACETIPSLKETKALVELLGELDDPEHPGRNGASTGISAWFSFSCKNAQEISDGSRLSEALALLAGQPGVVAVGVNCTDPSHISSLIRICRDETDLPVVVYPNSGEAWDQERKCWRPGTACYDLPAMAQEWREAGATMIGGCCRVGPDEIRRIRVALLS